MKQSQYLGIASLLLWSSLLLACFHEVVRYTSLRTLREGFAYAMTGFGSFISWNTLIKNYLNVSILEKLTPVLYIMSRKGFQPTFLIKAD
ncbi:MAG: hypothetical protein V7L29_05395 [Nostoc sp.]|uniref:hypothetical protein n=1 Tax=Nostoc sp. TaxID=1180 RepID=UPI002FF72282